MIMCQSGDTTAAITLGNHGMAEANARGRTLYTAMAVKGGPDEGGVELVEKRI